MLSNQPKFKYFFLVLDLVLLSASFLGAVLLEFTPKERSVFQLLLLSSLYVFFQVFIFQYNGLYKRHVIETGLRQACNLFTSLTYGLFVFLLLCLFILNTPETTLFNKHFVFKLFGLILIGELVLRVIVGRKVFLFLARKNYYRPSILIVGGDDVAIKVARSLRNSPLNCFNVVGFVDDNRVLHEPILDGLANLGRAGDIESIVRVHQVDEILIVRSEIGYNELIGLVKKCLSTGKVVRIHSSFLEVISRLLNVERYEDVPVIMLSPSDAGPRAPISKRTFDLVFSLLGVVLLSPVFLAVAIGIKLSSPGPVLYTQTRIGKNGVPFQFYKFRSMHVKGSDDAHKDFVQSFIKDSIACGSRNIRIFKITHDPRIFPFGSFIRKTSLDEFPQFFNVIKGDMSLVGPRPCLDYEWECYDEWHKNRLNILPGCTGLWQALGRSSVTFEEMVVLDLFYVNNVAVRNDVKIMFQTVPALLFGKGAY